MIHGETDINISSCCITLKKSDQAQKKSTHVQPCPYSSTAVTDCSSAPYSLLLTARELHTTLLNVHRELSQLHVTNKRHQGPCTVFYTNFYIVFFGPQTTCTGHITPPQVSSSSVSIFIAFHKKWLLCQLTFCNKTRVLFQPIASM